MTYISIVFAPLALIAGSFKLPESPRFLLKKNRTTEALDLLCRLHHTPDDPNNVMAKEEYLQISRQLEMDISIAKGFKGIMAIASYRNRFLLGVFVQ